MSDPIELVDAVERNLPLPEPLLLGPMRIERRHYTVVELRCRSGVRGVAYAQSRGAPLAATIERLLAPGLIGADAEDVAGRWAEMTAATVALGRGGLVARAIALVDIALWDAAGKRREVPVHQLLGAEGARPVRTIFVAGYPRGADRVEEVVEAAAAAATRGHRTVKVPRTPDPELTATTLRRLDESLPEGVEVVVDANWAWSTAREAAAEIEAWPLARLGWIEDPFVPERLEPYERLADLVAVPLAAGDDLTDPVHAEALLDSPAIAVLRLDVAALGGISGVAPLARRAADAATPISFHISAETSIHLATALAGERCDVETFDRRGNPFDPSHELVSGGPRFENGCALAPSTPGLGFLLR